MAEESIDKQVQMNIIPYPFFDYLDEIFADSVSNVEELDFDEIMFGLKRYNNDRFQDLVHEMLERAFEYYIEHKRQ